MSPWRTPLDEPMGAGSLAAHSEPPRRSRLAIRKGDLSSTQKVEPHEVFESARRSGLRNSPRCCSHRAARRPSAACRIRLVQPQRAAPANVDLPEPFSPTKATHLPRPDQQGHVVVDRGFGAAGIGRGDRLHLEDAPVRCRRTGSLVGVAVPWLSRGRCPRSARNGAGLEDLLAASDGALSSAEDNRMTTSAAPASASPRPHRGCKPADEYGAG